MDGFRCSFAGFPFTATSMSPASPLKSAVSGEVAASAPGHAPVPTELRAHVPTPDWLHSPLVSEFSQSGRRLLLDGGGDAFGDAVGVLERTEMGEVVHAFEGASRQQLGDGGGDGRGRLTIAGGHNRKR